MGDLVTWYHSETEVLAISMSSGRMKISFLIASSWKVVVVSEGFLYQSLVTALPECPYLQLLVHPSA